MLASDMDYRCQNLEQENNALRDENEDLRRKTQGLEQTSTVAIRNLEVEVDEGKRDIRTLK